MLAYWPAAAARAQDAPDAPQEASDEPAATPSPDDEMVVPEPPSSPFAIETSSAAAPSPSIAVEGQVVSQVTATAPPTAPPVGYSHLYVHLRGFVSADRLGGGASTEVDLQHDISSTLALALHVSPAYLYGGERIPGARGGLSAMAGVRFYSNGTTLGVYAGFLTIAQGGTPVAPVLAVSENIIADWLQSEATIIMGWDPTDQSFITIGDAAFRFRLDPSVQLFLHGLFPIAEQVTGEPKLGVLLGEAGARVFFSGDAQRPRLGLDLAVGVQMFSFHAQCAFGPCPTVDTLIGPIATVGLLYEYE